jgi:hypothetical protein
MEVAESVKQRPIEPPLTKTEGVGRIWFLTDVKNSKEVTGNGIDGHDTIVWDRRYKDQIEQAREKFYQLLDKGWIAFVVDDNGKPKHRIGQFEPTAEEVIMMTKKEHGDFTRTFDPNADQIGMVAPIAAG